MIKFLYKINRNFDEIPEPWRLVTFFAMVMPGIMMFSQSTGVFVTIGGVWVLTMLFVRMMYMHSWFKPSE